MINRIFLGIILLISSIGFGQTKSSENWTENELIQYSTLIKLANYIHQKEKSEISKDSLFKNYIFFENILNDTVTERKERRLVMFDTLFYYFRKTIDSIGLENLDAKPIRFYKDNKIYEPFDKDKSDHKTISGEIMYTKDANVFAWYRKEDPDSPIGALLFEPETGKLGAWIMISQGGYSYFLTFNLL